MIYINYKTEDGTPYTITINYSYDHKPAILRADPNDSCADESELNMRIESVGPYPNIHYEEIMDDWYCGALYDIAADKALDDYFGR